VFLIFIQKFKDVKGERFPSGRLTKVLIGPKNEIRANNFVMGEVKIDPHSSIPQHYHPNEEIYIILKGSGLMTVGEESEVVEAKSVIYIPPNQEHKLNNNTEQFLEILFVYSPANIVDHWKKERAGEII
jgi:quercetin dioxygenase-like cupin family protein